MNAPSLRILKGEPTAEELAAVVAVLMTRAAAAEPVPMGVSAWSARRSALRRPLHPGLGGWVASGRDGVRTRAGW